MREDKVKPRNNKNVTAYGLAEYYSD